MEHLENRLGECDFIFNTVPAMIIDEKRINSINKECIIVDLASAPGGIDFEAAEQKGIKAILALRIAWESGTIICS